MIYYGSEFGMTGADDPDNRRMMRFNDQLTVYEKRMLNATKEIVKMRNQHSALRYGDFLTLQADTTVYVYIRSDMNERILVLLNKTEKEYVTDVAIPEIYHAHELVDVIGGEKMIVKNSHANVSIPAIGWNVYSIR